MIYLIGSLRNKKIPFLANEIESSLTKEGWSAKEARVFDEWFAPGPEADDRWKTWAICRGMTFAQALDNEAARHIYEFDSVHLAAASQVVLACPAGRSGHLELGWALGHGKPGHILLEEGHPERWDVMYQFASSVNETIKGLIFNLMLWKQEVRQNGNA